MGDVLSLFSVIIMKFKSKFNESKIYFHYDLPWEKLKAVKWMNERASSNKAYVPTTFVNFIAFNILFAVNLNFSLSCIVIKTEQVCKIANKMKHFLHRCDRAMIYIFIASSYFPWLTVGTLSCWMLRELRWAIWLLAVLGITYQQIFHERYKMLELLLYLVMGLGPAAIIVTSNHYFPAMYDLKLGGILYLMGVFFFKSDGRIPFAHAIWHIFVALAATVHYLAILRHLFPELKSQ
ncbi:hypothetical protein K1T71_009617 [Dendrolimus kikuchii]|uniref:Uncharacterized protein n=1 Tax=Dendrolimus kikuchii TaxID=765133 RepID=A0ACC1CS55_9NEOP|nr:hypothetical protein K1T71_009617 [Dendrolimus kikuchii]